MRKAALTLVEVLMALALASMVLLGTYSVLAHAVRSQDQLTSPSSLRGNRSLERQLHTDLQRFALRALPKEEPLVGFGRPEENGVLLQFNVSCGQNPLDHRGVMSGSRKVTYFVRQDLSGAVLCRKEGAWQAADRDSGEALLEALADVRVRFLGQDGWRSRWPTRSGSRPLPRCVELTFTHRREPSRPVVYRVWLTQALSARPGALR